MLENSTNILFWIALGLTALSAMFLVSSTLFNVVRLRNVRLSWKAGKLKGYPLFSTLFLLFALASGLIAFRNGAISHMAVAGLYVWFGACWFTISYLTTKHFITDHGIVKNVNAPSQTVAWHQIRDFVEKDEENHTRYIFIYDAEDDKQITRLIRLEIKVPHKILKPFKKLISHKLGRRIRCYMDGEINVRQFDQR